MKTAVLLPCHNEEAAIAGVIGAFKAALPGAEIYVYDNASDDDTAAIAHAAGAIVRHEPRKGKGNVVRRMFADIEADIYVMADGDGTYEAAAAPTLIKRLIDDRLDMVVGVRAHEDTPDVYRRGHRLGNRMLNLAVRLIFGQGLNDMLSGYRVFSRRFVKSFPATARRFETETELTIHALHLRLPFAEMPTRYFTRTQGSASKLSTYKDGMLILQFIMFLFQDARPFVFFSTFALFLAVLSLILGLPLVAEYFETGLVPRLPTAILSVGIMLSALLAFVCGLIMETVSRGRQEHKRLVYLSLPAIGKDGESPA